LAAQLGISDDGGAYVNHLEELVAEWYEYQGYFVRRNVRVGRRPGGGHECELDVVAFHPVTKKLVQIEPSTDATSWATREMRYAKKFAAGKRHIPRLFQGLDVPNEIDQVALFLIGGNRGGAPIAGGRVLLVKELIVEILSALAGKRLYSEAVPESFPLIRTLQLVAEYRGRVAQALGKVHS